MKTKIKKEWNKLREKSLIDALGLYLSIAN